MNSPLENRRDFLKSGSTAAALTFAAPALLMRDRAFAANSDTIRIGLVGCGGRGTGAAGNALEADKNLVLVAMGDAFEDQLKQSHSSLDKQFPGRVQVEPSKRFVGLDAYQKVIDAGVDVVFWLRLRDSARPICATRSRRRSTSSARSPWPPTAPASVT